MQDIDKLLACSTQVARDLSDKFIFDVFATYHAHGSESAKQHVKSLNLASKAHEEYILDLVTYWPHRIGQMFVIGKPISTWYVYRLGEGVYQIQASTGVMFPMLDVRGMIPPSARKLLLGVLMAGHKCTIIGHTDFIILKINV